MPVASTSSPSVFTGCSEDSAPCHKTECEELGFECWFAHGNPYQGKNFGLTQVRADRLPLTDILAESPRNSFSLNLKGMPPPMAPPAALIGSNQLQSHPVLNL